MILYSPIDSGIARGGCPTGSGAAGPESVGLASTPSPDAAASPGLPGTGGPAAVRVQSSPWRSSR